MLEVLGNNGVGGRGVGCNCGGYMSEVFDLVEGLQEFQEAEKELDARSGSDFDSNLFWFERRDKAEKKIRQSIRAIIKEQL